MIPHDPNRLQPRDRLDELLEILREIRDLLKPKPIGRPPKKP